MRPIGQRVTDLTRVDVVRTGFGEARVVQARVARIAVPALAVAALGVGVAVSLPQPAATTAVPASSSSPLGRASEEAVSRANLRPALPAASTAARAADRAAEKKAAATKAAEVRVAEVRAAKAAAAAKAAKAAVAKKAAEPKKTGAAGTRYAEVTLNLRSAPQDSARTATDVASGAKVAVTGYVSTSWAQVKSGRRTGWVKATYLATSKSKVAAPAGGASSRAGTDISGPCASGSSVENGLTPDAIKVHRAICHRFPSVKSYGGVRPDSLPEHPSGRALDAMIATSSQGRAIATWVRAHASQLGVSQVLYAQHIWTVQRSSEGWRSMSDRGSATANHYDHVHVTVYGNAAK
ncbi:MAG: SH3 domain-containing protein [Propionibacteriaceae bacterium]